MQVLVDGDRCEGHARCAGLCPEVFDLDDDGFAVVRTPDVPESLRSAVETAASNCPEGAISIHHQAAAVGDHR